MADNQVPPQGAEPNLGPPGYGSATSRPSKAFRVDDKSLQQLHKTFQMLVADLKEINRQLGGIGKQSGVQDLLGVLGRGGGGGGSRGGGSSLSTGSMPQPQHDGNRPGAGGAVATLTPAQKRNRVIGGAVGAAAVAPGAYLASNFSSIAQMNFVGNQFAQGATGGYSMGVQNGVQRQLAGLTGYRNTGDLVTGAQTLSPFAGSAGTSRFSSTFSRAGSFANLNPSLGLTGASQAMSSLYAPQTNTALMSMGMGTSIGAGGALSDPQTVARNILTRIYRGKMWTSQMITEGMQPGAPLYRSLQFLDPQTQQYIAEYGIAMANLGGDPAKVKAALANPKGGLARQAGIGQSMISQMNSLGQSQTQLQTNMGIDAAGPFKTATDVFSKAVDTFSRVAQGGGGALGVLGVGGMVGSGAASKTLGLGGGFLGYNLGSAVLKSAKNTSLSRRILGTTGVVAEDGLTGGVKGALGGAISDTVGIAAAKAAGAVPVYVINWPGGGVGGGGGGGGLGRFGKLGKAGGAAEGVEGAEGAEGIGGIAGLEGTGAAAAGGSMLAGAGIAAGIGAVGYFGGQAITHIGMRNGKKNKAARLAGDTASGAAVGAAVGSVVPVIGTAAGAAIGGAIGFVKGGGVGDTVGLLETKHDNAKYQQQYNNLLSQSNSQGYNLVPEWVTEFTSGIAPMASAAQILNRKKPWLTVIAALTALNKRYAAKAAAAIGGVRRSNYANAYAATAMSGSNPYGNETGDSGNQTAQGSGITWPRIEAMMGKGSPSHRVTATTNGTHAKNSYHYKGEAVDFAGPKPSVDSPDLLAINQFWAKNYGHELAELIYAGPGGINIKNGKVVSGMSVYGADTMSEHHNHVHVAATPETLGLKGGVSVPGGSGGSGGGGGTGSTSTVPSVSSASGMGFLGNPSSEEVDTLAMLLNSMGGGASAVHAGATAAGTASGASGTSGGQGTYGNKKPNWGGSPGAAPSNPSGSAAMGKQMAAAVKWTGAEWDALYQLWTRESGWDANSVNKSSGAYGIPQALGHGHPYNLGDSRSQIAWGISYIQQRYGDPLKAWAHEKSVGWYDKGAREVLNDQMAVVHKGETVVPAREASQMRALLKAQQRASQLPDTTITALSRLGQRGSGGGVVIQLTAPMTITGAATVADAQKHVDNVVSALQQHHVIQAIGAGVS